MPSNCGDESGGTTVIKETGIVEGIAAVSVSSWRDVVEDR